MTTLDKITDKLAEHLLENDDLNIFKLNYLNPADYPLDEYYAEYYGYEPDLLDIYTLKSLTANLVRTFKFRLINELLNLNNIQQISKDDLIKEIQNGNKYWISGEETEEVPNSYLDSLAEFNNIYVDGSLYRINNELKNIVPINTAIQFFDDFKLTLNFYEIELGKEVNVDDENDLVYFVKLKLIPTIEPDSINKYKIFRIN